MDMSTIQPLLDWLVQHPTLSGVVVFSIAAIESLVVVGILVPGVAFMLGVGTLVGLGLLPVWSTLFWAAAGAVFGDGLGYWLGRHFDKQLRHIWPMTKYPDLIPKGERFFKRHGGKSIVFGRFVGPVRSIIPAIAGMMHMRPGYFYLVNILSAIAWAPAVILPGAAFGASLGLASDVALRLAVVLVTVFFVIWFIAWMIKKLFGNQLASAGRRVFLIANTLYLRRPVQTLASAAAICMFVLCLVILFSVIEEAPTRFDVTSKNWQQSAWQILPAYRINQAEQTALRIQWQGELPEIQSLLHKDGWRVVERMKLTNAIRWLTPNAQLEKLPLWQTRFNAGHESLMMAASLADVVSAEEVSEDHTAAKPTVQPPQVLLRLWPVATKQANKIPVWIGSLSVLSIKATLADVNLLHEAPALQPAWRRFQQTLDNSAELISMQWMLRSEQISHPAYLAGDVVLVSNKELN